MLNRTTFNVGVASTKFSGKPFGNLEYITPMLYALISIGVKRRNAPMNVFNALVQISGKEL